MNQKILAIQEVYNSDMHVCVCVCVCADVCPKILCIIMYVCAMHQQILAMKRTRVARVCVCVCVRERERGSMSKFVMHHHVYVYVICISACFRCTPYSMVIYIMRICIHTCAYIYIYTYIHTYDHTLHSSCIYAYKLALVMTSAHA